MERKVKRVSGWQKQEEGQRLLVMKDIETYMAQFDDFIVSVIKARK